VSPEGIEPSTNRLRVESSHSALFSTTQHNAINIGVL
jgi:hypothetical protein